MVCRGVCREVLARVARQVSLGGEGKRCKSENRREWLPQQSLDHPRLHSLRTSPPSPTRSVAVRSPPETLTFTRVSPHVTSSIPVAHGSQAFSVLARERTREGKHDIVGVSSAARCNDDYGDHGDSFHSPALE
ncbi:unnamed protein product [Ectocarpus sp. 12 AP-2014]